MRIHAIPRLVLSIVVGHSASTAFKMALIAIRSLPLSFFLSLTEYVNCTQREGEDMRYGRRDRRTWSASTRLVPVKENRAESELERARGRHGAAGCWREISETIVYRHFPPAPGIVPGRVDVAVRRGGRHHRPPPPSNLSNPSTRVRAQACSFAIAFIHNSSVVGAGRRPHTSQSRTEADRRTSPSETGSGGGARFFDLAEPVAMARSRR